MYDISDADELASAHQSLGPIVVNVMDTNGSSDATEFLQSVKAFMEFLLPD